MERTREYYVSLTVKSARGRFDANGAVVRSDGGYGQGKGAASNLHTAVGRAVQNAMEQIRDGDSRTRADTADANGTTAGGATNGPQRDTGANGSAGAEQSGNVPRESR